MIEKEKRMATLVMHIDNHIYDTFKSSLTWLPILKIPYPDFIDYYKKHGLHNIDIVIKD